MSSALDIAVIVLTALLVATAVLAWHFRRSLRRVQSAGAKAANLIEMWQRNETVAGAYELSQTEDRRAAMLAGVERCYYVPPDLASITWVPRDIPTPFVGYAPQPGRMASAVINNSQFRYDRELDVPKLPNVCRIFLTGSSAAFGCGASSNQTTIGGYLEGHLNVAGKGTHFEVVTAAACAWSSSHERILIENRLLEMQPDLVISFSGHNDAYWATRGFNSLWFRAFQDDYFLALMNAALGSNGALQFPGANVEEPVSMANAAERLRRNVEQSLRVLQTVGSGYIFALQPTMQASRKVLTAREARVAAAVSEQPWFTQMKQFNMEFGKVLSGLAEPGFRFLDMTGVFDDCGADVDIFIDTCHFGDRGNDLIARSLCGPVLRTVKDRL